VTANDRVLLDSILVERRAAIAPDMREDDFFEFFVAEQLLLERDLAWEEVLSGICGGGGDGGIDALYVFFNGQLTSPGTATRTSTTAAIELVVIQAKRSPGFDESSIQKLESSLSRLLDLEQPLDDLSDVFNTDVINIMAVFRDLFVRNANRFPTLTIRVIYASKGVEVHPNISRAGNACAEHLRGLFSNCVVDLRFVKPRDLLDIGYRQRPSGFDLRVSEIITTARGGYVGLVRLQDYFDFVSDDAGMLRTSLLESNVRDYESRTGVNAAMAETLNHGQDDDFWWLNNGITIVAERAAQAGKTITLQRPQIVNGLQTTQEIYQYVRGQSDGWADERLLLVRIVVPPTDQSRDRIIRATNSQTTIPGIALHATEVLHRDIEAYFLRYGLFYERRRNRYQNEGRPVSAIITIPFLAEAVLALALGAPHIGNPRLGGRFLRDGKLYGQIFSDKRTLHSYFLCAAMARRVEILARDASRHDQHTGRTFSRLVFAASLGIVLSKAGGLLQEGIELDISAITVADVQSWLTKVDELAASVRGRAPSKKYEVTIAREIAVAALGEDAALRAGFPEVALPGEPRRQAKALDSRQRRALSKAIDAVMSGGQPVALPVMPGPARSAVHHLIAERHPALTSQSRGEEPERYVVLSPAVADTAQATSALDRA
jgi:hypothetical protein